MLLPPPETPLYNHPLPQIEYWLREQGCERDEKQLHCWRLQQSTWQAELSLDIEQIIVRYLEAGDDGQDIQRAFKYSLSREDVERAVFSGP